MKHVCVAARIVDNAKPDGANMSILASEGDKVSDDSGRNPCESLHISAAYPGAGTSLAHGVVIRLDRILDTLCGRCLALSQTRDSASRVSLC
jgi:hypothetical protein